MKIGFFNVISNYPYDFIFIHELLNRLNKSKSLILDVGCGIGKKTQIFTGTFSSVFGLDLSFDSIKEAKKKGIKVVLGDAECLSFRDSSFEVLVSVHVIEHLANPGKFIFEIYRVLKEGGIAILVTPNRIRWFQRIYKFITGKNEFVYPMNSEHRFEYTKSDLYSLMKVCHFSMYEIVPSFLGIMITFFGKKINFGIRTPRGILAKYCNSYIVYAKK